MPSHVVQAALLERFGILISIGHLNRVRAELGLGSRAGHWEKNGSFLGCSYEEESPCPFQESRFL